MAVPLISFVFVMQEAVASPSCGAEPPVAHVVAVGTATGPRAEATLAALEIAHTRLGAQICQGLSASRCAVVKQHIRDWAPTWDEATRTACAQAAIDRGLLDLSATEAEAFEMKIRALADSLSTGLDGLPLWIDPPDTAGARRVTALILASIAESGVVPLAEVESGSGRLRLQADVGKSTTVITALLELAGGKEIALRGFTVANDILGANETVSSGLGEELTLVVSASKNGSAELRSGGSIRQGDKVVVFATVDHPAFLYLIYDDGGGQDVLLSREGLYAAPGVPTRLPQPGRVLQVDEEAGKTERLTVIASRKPLPQELLTTGSAASTVRRMRGFDVVEEATSTVFPAQAPTWLSDPTPVVSGYGAAVYTLSLEHR